MAIGSALSEEGTRRSVHTERRPSRTHCPVTQLSMGHYPSQAHPPPHTATYLSYHSPPYFKYIFKERPSRSVIQAALPHPANDYPSVQQGRPPEILHPGLFFSAFHFPQCSAISVTILFYPMWSALHH